MFRAVRRGGASAGLARSDLVRPASQPAARSSAQYLHTFARQQQQQQQQQHRRTGQRTGGIAGNFAQRDALDAWRTGNCIQYAQLAVPLQIVRGRKKRIADDNFLEKWKMSEVVDFFEKNIGKSSYDDILFKNDVPDFVADIPFEEPASWADPFRPLSKNLAGLGILNAKPRDLPEDVRHQYTYYDGRAYPKGSQRVWEAYQRHVMKNEVELKNKPWDISQRNPFFGQISAGVMDIEDNKDLVRKESESFAGYLSIGMPKDRLVLLPEVVEAFGDENAKEDAYRGQLLFERCVRQWAKEYRYIPVGMRLHLKDPQFSPYYQTRDSPLIMYMIFADDVIKHNGMSVEAHCDSLDGAVHRPDVKADAAYVRDKLAGTGHDDARELLYDFAIAEAGLATRCDPDATPAALGDMYATMVQAVAAAFRRFDAVRADDLHYGDESKMYARTRCNEAYAEFVDRMGLPSRQEAALYPKVQADGRQFGPKRSALYRLNEEQMARKAEMGLVVLENEILEGTALDQVDTSAVACLQPEGGGGGGGVGQIRGREVDWARSAQYAHLGILSRWLWETVEYPKQRDAQLMWERDVGIPPTFTSQDDAARYDLLRREQGRARGSTTVDLPRDRDANFTHSVMDFEGPPLGFTWLGAVCHRGALTPSHPGLPIRHPSRAKAVRLSRQDAETGATTYPTPLWYFRPFDGGERHDEAQESRTKQYLHFSLGGRADDLEHRGLRGGGVLDEVSGSFVDSLASGAHEPRPTSTSAVTAAAAAEGFVIERDDDDRSALLLGELERMWTQGGRRAAARRRALQTGVTRDLANPNLQWPALAAAYHFAARRGFPLNANTHALVMDSLLAAGRGDGVCEVFAVAKRVASEHAGVGGFSLDSRHYSLAIRAHNLAGRFIDAHHCFDDARLARVQVDVTAYQALLQSVGKNGANVFAEASGVVEQAMEYLRAMTHPQLVVPNNAVFHAFIEACVRGGGGGAGRGRGDPIEKEHAIDAIFQAINEMNRLELNLSAVTLNKIFKAFDDLNASDMVPELWRSWEESDILSKLFTREWLSANQEVAAQQQERTESLQGLLLRNVMANAAKLAESPPGEGPRDERQKRRGLGVQFADRVRDFARQKGMTMSETTWLSYVRAKVASSVSLGIGAFEEMVKEAAPSQQAIELMMSRCGAVEVKPGSINPSVKPSPAHGLVALKLMSYMRTYGFAPSEMLMESLFEAALHPNQWLPVEVPRSDEEVRAVLRKNAARLEEMMAESERYRIPESSYRKSWRYIFKAYCDVDDTKEAMRVLTTHFETMEAGGGENPRMNTFLQLNKACDRADDGQTKLKALRFQARTCGRIYDFIGQLPSADPQLREQMEELLVSGVLKYVAKREEKAKARASGDDGGGGGGGGGGSSGLSLIEQAANHLTKHHTDWQKSYSSPTRVPDRFYKECFERGGGDAEKAALLMAAHELREALRFRMHSATGMEAEEKWRELHSKFSVVPGLSEQLNARWEALKSDHNLAR